MPTHEHAIGDHFIAVDIYQRPPLFYNSTPSIRLFSQPEVEIARAKVALTKEDADKIAQIEFDAR